MEELFAKFCRYYVLNGTEEEYQELVNLSGPNFKEYQKKALKFSKNLKRKTQKMGFNIDFESFCNMLEDYINKKDNLSDPEKKNYLKILLSLSNIHDINLREELEKYVSYKDSTNDDELYKNIFKKFCCYNLTTNNTVEDFNDLKSLAQENNLDFYELQQKSISFVEEIKELIEKLGFSNDENSFYQMVDEYKNQKKHMTDTQKASYLRILLYLSEIYEVNLRELLFNSKDINSENKENSFNLNNIINPLDNNILLSDMLSQRFNNGQFDIENLYQVESNQNSEYDYSKIQANLIFKLFRIFIDKMSNYAYEDLNPKYSSLIGEEELSLLDSLTEEKIYNILIDINKSESNHYICKKYKITDNLYKFILLSANEATNLKDNIKGSTYSLFNYNYSKPTIAIYISGEEKNIFNFLNDYIKQCIQNDLSYDLESSYNRHNNTYILLSNKEEFMKKINILDSLAQKWNKKLFKPNPITRTINDTYYGITDIGMLYPENDILIPYFSYIDIISEVSYYRILSKLIVNKITDTKAQDIINNFISLNDLKINNIESLEFSINDNNFDMIKDLVNQYIPLVINTLNIYMEDQRKKENIIIEFRKSLLYISNILSKNDKKENSNIALNNLLKNL